MGEAMLTYVSAEEFRASDGNELVELYK